MKAQHQRTANGSVDTSALAVKDCDTPMRTHSNEPHVHYSVIEVCVSFHMHRALVLRIETLACEKQV
jgi:hypothetical protein